MAERATTDRQQRILDVICEFTSECGYPPSVREIGQRVGLSSSSTVQSHLKTLEKRGLLRRDPTKPRALVPRDMHPSGRAPSGGPIVSLPIVGKVAAGVPITAVENVEDHFTLPASFARRPGSFMLRVSGDSMIDAAILDGDLIVVQPQPNAENGEIVVAMLDGEATVKRFYREAGRVRLQPENSTMQPIYADDVTIVGKVEAVIRKIRDYFGSGRAMIDRLLAGFSIDPRVLAAARAAAPRLLALDVERRAHVRAKVINAFVAEGIAESDLAGTTGYGYDDPARERYESLLARLFAAERALARLSLVSGTHAIVTSLAACVGPGELLLSATGRPYDTLHHAIVDAPYSLVYGGIRYEEVPLDAGGRTDPERIAQRCLERTPAAVFVQRSRGYSARPSLTIDDCAAVVDAVKEGAPNAIVIVDNCYGELVEEREPLEIGADLVVGSLIKNLGGGIAPTGGYVAGRAALLDRIAARLYAPGLGAALGPSLGFGRAFLQGLFYAPLVIDEALRGLDFAADLFARLGFTVDPAPGSRRTDIIQAIRLGEPRRLLAFARGLQRALPVNARFAPIPGAVPGYLDPVVMSSGAFISGATIELSCDAPMRAPFDVYLQGGVMAEHVAIGAALAADAVLAEA